MRNFGTEESVGYKLGSATAMAVAEQRIYHAASSDVQAGEKAVSQLLLPLFSGELGFVPSSSTPSRL
jgi:hypothetical protein